MEMRKVMPHEALEPMKYYLCDCAVETPEGHDYVVAGPFETKAEGAEAKTRLCITRQLTAVMMCG